MQINKPELTIIIINYNTCELTTNCIQSIYEKTENLSFEIILVDNNSIDNSCDLIGKRFKEIRIIRNSKNFGFAKAANIGVKFAKGKYICFLNSDTILLNNAMREMVSKLRSDEKIGIIGPLMYYPDMRIQETITEISFIGIILRILGFKKNVCRIIKEILNKFPSGYFLKMGKGLLGACLMMRMELFISLNGFDENFFFTGEEGDLILNAMRNNWKVLYFPKSKIIHHHGGTINSLSEEHKRDILCAYYSGLLYFCRKNYGFSLFVIARLLTIFSLLLKKYVNYFISIWKKDVYSKIIIYEHVIRRL